MEKKFYISFTDISHNSGNFPNDIKLKKIIDFESAIEHIEGEYSVLEEFTFDSNKWSEPVFITNDNLLFMKYRNVFSEEEFKSYCIESSLYGEQIDELPLKNQIIARKSKLKDKDEKETFEHFQNIKTNKYKEAYMYKKYTNNWIDEDTGRQYDYDEESGWKTRNWIDDDDDIQFSYG